MAWSKRAKRAAKKRRTCRAHEAVMEVIHAPRREPAEDPRIVVLNARARHFGPACDPQSVMLADPAGQAILLGARDADEAAGLWNVFARYDAADETYFRRIIGRHRFANVARLDMLPERFETRADDRPDLRSEDERDRDAVTAWMRWQGALQSLGPYEASLIIRASRQTCGALVIGGRLSTTGSAFVAAMRSMRQVVGSVSV